MVAAIIVFGLAALGGVGLAVLQLRGQGASVPMAVGHGVLGAVGLILLGIAAFGAGGGGLASASFVVMILAALGGSVLFARHLRGQPLSNGLVLGHGAMAVVGFVLLLAAAI